jgi:hypothetical protein
MGWLKRLIGWMAPSWCSAMSPPLYPAPPRPKAVCYCTLSSTIVYEGEKRCEVCDWCHEGH